MVTEPPTSAGRSILKPSTAHHHPHTVNQHGPTPPPSMGPLYYATPTIVRPTSTNSSQDVPISVSAAPPPGMAPPHQYPPFGVPPSHPGPVLNPYLPPLPPGYVPFGNPPPPGAPPNQVFQPMILQQQQLEYQAAMDLEMWKMTQEQAFKKELKSVNNNGEITNMHYACSCF